MVIPASTMHTPRMRAIVQRVSEADVVVDNEVVGAIGRGLLVYLGAGRGDSDADLHYIVNKIRGLRVFKDAEGKMSLSVEDVRGAVLVVSQFTLYGDARKGRRPSFTAAAAPDDARALYERAIAELERHGLEVQSGRFQATMNVRAQVDGPVTIQIDSQRTY